MSKIDVDSYVGGATSSPHADFVKIFTSKAQKSFQNILTRVSSASKRRAHYAPAAASDRTRQNFCYTPPNQTGLEPYSMKAKNTKSVSQFISAAETQADEVISSTRPIRAIHEKGRPNNSTPATATAALTAWGLFLKHWPK